MSGTGSGPGIRGTPGAKGNIRTMIIGTGVAAIGLASFFYGQRLFRSDVDNPNPNQTPTWQHRIEQQRLPPEGAKISNAASGAEPRTGGPEQLPLPDKGQRGEGGSSLSPSNWFKPDKDQQSHDESAPHGPQRETDRGTVYTKSSKFTSGYSDKPENYEKSSNAPGKLDGVVDRENTGDRSG